jgi:uncharacterized delta-60 repeat protein
MITPLPGALWQDIRPRDVNLAIDPNSPTSDPHCGRIVVTAEGEVVRYDSNGTLDKTFGPNNTGSESVANLGLPAVAIQPDDRIVLAGTVTAANGNLRIGVDRLNPEDGTFDTSFGTGGVVVTPLLIGDAVTRAVTIQSDGKILAAGLTDNAAAQPGGFLLARYNTDGSLDTTFGSGGIALGGTNVILEAEGVALEPDGRIVMAGRSKSGTAFELARFLAAGPEIGSFTALTNSVSTNSVTAGSSLTLTASNITDANPGTAITQVAFYYFDSSGTQQSLGNITQSSPGVWTLTFTLNLAPWRPALIRCSPRLRTATASLATRSH